MRLPSILPYIYNKLRNGANEYLFTEDGRFGINGSNIDIAQDHPILTPAILFVSKLFAQAEFNIKNKNTGKNVNNHWFLNLIDKPNFFQTKIDFLECLSFTMIATGVSIVYAKRTIGMQPNSMYILDARLLKYPEGFKTEMLNYNQYKNSNITLKYDEDGENLDIKLKDLLFFYDLPNGLQKNKTKNKSRLDGLHQTLENTKDSLIAKNIILKTNGKELITTENKNGFPLTPDEKKRIEGLYHANYGMGRRRKRGIITKASLTWKSLHIALRDLGLDESIKVDGNLIYTALHIPKDILSLEAKKTTYNNFKESMVSYIQNETQSTLNAFNSVMQQLIDDDNKKLEGNYNHLPVMQFVLLEKYNVVLQQATALNALLRTGIPKEVALPMCGFDKNLELNELKDLSNGQTNNSGNSNNENEEDGEEKNRRTSTVKKLHA